LHLLLGFLLQFRIRVPDLGLSGKAGLSGLSLRFHPVVGAGFAFSTFIAKKVSAAKSARLVEFAPTGPTYERRVAK